MQENKEVGSNDLAQEEIEQTEVTKEVVDTDGAESTEVAQEEKKPKKLGGFQRKALRLEAELSTLRDEVATLKAGKSETAQAAVDLKKPNEDYFKTTAEYLEALSDYKAEVKIQAFEKKLESKKTNESAKSENAEKQNAYIAKAKEYEKANPDFQEALQNDFDEYGEGMTFNKTVHDFLSDSDLSPALVHEFAKDREILENIKSMSPAQAMRELVNLEIKLKNKSPKTTKAPAPIQSKAGNGATNLKSKDPLEENISQAEYESRRWAQIQAAKKRA